MHYSKTLLLSTILVGTLTAASYAEEKETMIPWKDAPAAAQKTINDNADGQKVDKVEKESENGKMTYEAKIKHEDGSRKIIETDENGKLISVKNKSAEIEVQWDKVPASVQKTITENANGQKIEKVEKETVDGKVIYEGKTADKLMIKVGDDGKLIKVKTKKS